MTQTTTERPTRPVHAQPRYDERDPYLPYVDQDPAAARWDLAFGAYAHYLLRVVSEEAGPVQCRTGSAEVAR